jgi:hypothetical protein
MDDVARDIAHVGRLLKAGLGLRGDDLAGQMRRGGRLLPRRVRAAALRLAKAQAMLGAPKLARQLDTAALGRDAKLCIAHLTPLVQLRTRHDWWLRAASWAALMVVICAAVLYALWHLRGALGL